MRLRVTVQRNGLPAANILWSVPDTSSGTAYTVTRLLEDVNHIIPLEAEHWGLEHYVVEVAGFECLHFSPVAQALKEDDHVSIRPLMTAEVRARTLTGRHQISDDGRHLVDGVPFGKPYLRQSKRPAVRIPPRKRRRLDHADTEEQGEVIGLLRAHGEDEEDETEGSDAVEEGAQSIAPENISKRGSKKVHFQQPCSSESEGSDEEDDEDFVPEADSDNDVAMDDDSEDQTDSESEAAAEASSSASDTSASDSSSDSDSDSESDASSPPDVVSSKHVPPGEGRKATNQRNIRRAQSLRLRRLKEAGKLPDNANLSDLRDYDAGERLHDVGVPPLSKGFSNAQGKRKRLDGDQDQADRDELERRKKELMGMFEPETSSNTTQTCETDPIISAAEADAASSLPQSVPPEEVPTKSTNHSRRLRPDTSAISRILARQTRPLVKKAKTVPVLEDPPEPEGVSDPDFWKSKINLSAFECWDEDFELTAPPFPFKQHWDPASKLMRDKANKKKQKKLGRNGNSFPVEQEVEEDNIILDYDEIPAIDSSDVHTSAAIEDQLRQDVEAAAQTDLPPLPEDLGALAALQMSDIKEGAIIVCKFFAVNPVTITPEISGYKTALVEREGDSGNGAGTIQLRLAQRDLPKKEIKFDCQGNRLYDTGDGFFVGDDDTDDDQGLWEGSFVELIEGKLLKAA